MCTSVLIADLDLRFGLELSHFLVSILGLSPEGILAIPHSKVAEAVASEREFDLAIVSAPRTKLQLDSIFRGKKTRLFHYNGETPKEVANTLRAEYGL